MKKIFQRLKWWHWGIIVGLALYFFQDYFPPTFFKTILYLTYPITRSMGLVHSIISQAIPLTPENILIWATILKITSFLRYIIAGLFYFYIFKLILRIFSLILKIFRKT